MPQRISDVPDVLRLIFKLLDKHDLARLMRVSRHFFVCTVPLLWAEVLDTKQLLRILPIDKTRTDNLEPLGDKSLRRFQLYAPYITKLTKYIRQKGLDPPSDILIELVPMRPLLPNLRELTLHLPWKYGLVNDEDPRASLEVLPIIEPFLSPTLVEIHTVDRQRKGFHPVLTSKLTEIIARICPNIQILDMYSNNDTMRNTTSSVSLSGVTISYSLLKLSNLRILGISPEVLFPDALALLGSLPQLKSLSVFSPDEHPATIDLNGTLISSDSFPALRHLAVFRSGESVGLISQLWKIPSLVRRLVSVYVKFDPDSDTGDWYKIRDTIFSICRGSPYITDLHIDMEDVYLSTEFLYSPLVLNQLKCLPLQRLRILDSLFKSAMPCDWNQLGLSLPHLEYLHIDVPPVTVQDLTAIARTLPMLRFLLVQLDLSWTEGEELPPELSFRASTTATPSLRLNIFDFDVDNWPSIDDCVKTMSTSLHNLWPNGVYCECWRHYIDNSDACEEINMLINDSIKQLCAPNEIDVLSVDEIAAGWKHVRPSRIPWVKYTP